MARGRTHTTHRYGTGSTGRGNASVRHAPHLHFNNNRAHATFRRRYRGGLGNPPQNVPSGGRLVDRITYDGGREGNKVDNTACPANYINGPRTHSNTNLGRSLVDRMTFDEGETRNNVPVRRPPRTQRQSCFADHMELEHVETSQGSNLIEGTQAQVNYDTDVPGQFVNRTWYDNGRSSRSQGHTDAAGAQTHTQFTNSNLESESGLNDAPQATSTIFYDSQFTQASESSAVATRLPSPAPGFQADRPRRLLRSTPKRHYAYRGKDPIKRLCSNVKLRAILTDRPVRSPRKRHDQMELRMGLRSKGFNNL